MPQLSKVCVSGGFFFFCASPLLEKEKTYWERQGFLASMVYVDCGLYYSVQCTKYTVGPIREDLTF